MISELQTNLPIPVSIIGGYLGCGKTTLVNHLLRNANGTRLAVLVNDFGELPIDADLIKEQTGDVISLTGGCVCCSYGDDLTSALLDLQKLSELPDHIVIEASGVALPGAIGGALSLQRKLALRSIIVIADAATVKTTAADKYLADTIERQLTDADLILLNKLDLVTPEEIVDTEYWLNTVNPQARVIQVTNCKVAPSLLLDGAPYQHNETTGQKHDPGIFQTIELSVASNTDATALAKCLASEACALVRAKGFVQDHDGEIKTIQVVGRRWSVTPAPTGVSTGIVCIGKSGVFTEDSVRKVCNLD